MEKNQIVENKSMLIAYIKASIDEKENNGDCLPLLKQCSDELYNLHMKGVLFKDEN